MYLQDSGVVFVLCLLSSCLFELEQLSFQQKSALFIQQAYSGLRRGAGGINSRIHTHATLFLLSLLEAVIRVFLEQELFYNLTLVWSCLVLHMNR